MLDTVRKTLDLFSGRERWKLVGIFGAALVTGLVETFSVASIMPFMAVVGDPSIVERNVWLGRLEAWLGADTASGFLLALALLTLLVLVAAHAVSAVTTWILMRFVWRKHSEVSTRLYERYLSRPYTYFLNENTSRLSKSLLTDAQSVFRGVLAPLLDAGVRGVVALFILAFLLYLDPVVALASAGVLGAAYGLLWRSIRTGQERIGREQLDRAGMRYKLAAEGFDGVKELKVLGREGHMVRRFRRVTDRYSDITVGFELAARLPRNLMEVVAYGGILLVAVYLIVTREGLGRALPLVSAFGFAGYKLMPALQGLFADLHQVKFHSAALDGLHEDLFGGGDEGIAATAGASAASEGPAVERPSAAATGAAGPSPDTDRGAPLRPEESLELDRVTYVYPGAGTAALRDVSIRIPRGSMVGFVGATGSGKTTLVDLVLGLLRPTEGALRVDGAPITDERLPAWQRNLGYVPQEIFLSDESVARNIALGLEEDEVDRERVEWAARLARIHDFVADLPRGYDTVVGERGVRLSGGQRQRIGIARALYRDPAVLVLDEGTSALDGVTEREVTEGITGLRPARTLLWVAHRLVTVRACDRVFLLDEGRVASEGSYEELLDSSPRFRAMARAGSEEAS